MRGYRSVLKIGFISAALSGQGGLISRTVASNRAYSQNGSVNTLACEQAVRGALSAGREREGELATTSLEFEYLLRKSDVITLGTRVSMLFTFAFVSPSLWLAKIWKSPVDGEPQGNWRGNSNCKLSFLYPPRRQDAPKSCSQAINIRVRVICDVLLFFWPRQFLNSWLTVACISLRSF